MTDSVSEHLPQAGSAHRYYGVKPPGYSARDEYAIAAVPAG
ncbi:hypothetical protein Q8A64_04045 [Oxalobacteraceae bacterium R-40]|uniref:Uncharacterized protein n=1 Tax=Keguizhuia sedimenti TaxID=3064264 RepID=A0ABU1BKR5_9BURK|nr:hypothetical protein [Oxalobacteraceae bacterium R-40]